VRTAIALIILSTLMTACSRDSSPALPQIAGAEHSTPLQWIEGGSLAQDENRVIMRANNGGQLFHVDLSTVGVFDCRIDCFSTANGLEKIEPSDRLCIGYLYIEDGVQVRQGLDQSLRVPRPHNTTLTLYPQAIGVVVLRETPS
jgi:hypothetical protein